MEDQACIPDNSNMFHSQLPRSQGFNSTSTGILSDCIQKSNVNLLAGRIIRNRSLGDYPDYVSAEANKSYVSLVDESEDGGWPNIPAIFLDGEEDVEY